MNICGTSFQQSVAVAANIVQRETLEEEHVNRQTDETENLGYKELNILEGKVT